MKKLETQDVADIKSAVLQRDRLAAYVKENLTNFALAKKYKIKPSVIDFFVSYKVESDLILPHQQQEIEYSVMRRNAINKQINELSNYSLAHKYGVFESVIDKVTNG